MIDQLQQSTLIYSTRVNSNEWKKITLIVFQMQSKFVILASTRSTNYRRDRSRSTTEMNAVEWQIYKVTDPKLV